MEDLVTVAPTAYELMDRNGLASLIFIGVFIMTAVFSFKRGRAEDVLKEVLENLFLCFLLICGFSQILLVPVDNDDEITAGIFFMAFGVCRFAKIFAKNNNSNIDNK